MTPVTTINAVTQSVEYKIKAIVIRTRLPNNTLIKILWHTSLKLLVRQIFLYTRIHAILKIELSFESIVMLYVFVTLDTHTGILNMFVIIILDRMVDLGIIYVIGTI
jgi:hypothetical protein